MLIALDAMGGDHAPGEIVAGALLAHRERGIEVALVGPKDVLEAELIRQGAARTAMQIVHASEVIGMDEHPAQAVRAKKDSSINVAMGLVKRGVAGGFVSAGNTGACMASALLTLGRIHGIERPALGTIAPFSEKGGMLVLDIGANADVKPSYMVQFAQMGSVYAERVMGIKSPRVALLNIGEEETKGNEFTQDVFQRLQHAGVNFIGNIEGGEVARGKADVIVTDGFTGNVAIKVTEGVAEFIFRELRKSLTAKWQYKLAALVLRPGLLAMRDRMDPGTYGGAPLLGVNGFVLIGHGNSNARSIKNALVTASEGAQSGMLDSIRDALHRK